MKEVKVRLTRECGCQHHQLPGRWVYCPVPPIMRSIKAVDQEEEI